VELIFEVNTSIFLPKYTYKVWIGSYSRFRKKILQG